MFNNLQQKDIFWLAPVATLAIGILPMPIGYYTLLRIIVCGGSAYFSYQFYKKKEVPKTWIFGFFAVLYNPFIPIYLYQKSIWTLINIITITMFWLNKKNIN